MVSIFLPVHFLFSSLYWALCSPSFTGRVNIYTLQLHRVSNVRVLEDGRECLDS